MGKLDAYLLGKYLKTFFFTAFLFSIIAVVIDFSEKVERFVESPVTTREILLQYYPTYLPDINSILWPLFALISVVFFCSRMAKNSEFVAMFSSGFSFLRISRPFILGAAVIASLLYVGNHYFLPKTNKIKLDFMNKYIERQQPSTRVRATHMFISPDTKVYINSYNTLDSTANDIRFETYKDDELVKILMAKRMQYKESPNHWTISDLEERHFDGTKEEFEIRRSDRIDTVLNIYPEDFVSWQNDQKRLTSPQIEDYLERAKFRGAGNTKPFEIEYYKRTADPVSIFILTIIGVAVASRKVRGGTGLHLAQGVMIGSLYIFLSRFSTTFATDPNVSPWLGVWAPNLVFAVVAWYLVRRAQE
ncbi:MAG: LptF/LptG family permease [Saprospiraceae bacterium]|nr:LptF/LptG family permease [Saprospiraceae bacterium]